MTPEEFGKLLALRRQDCELTVAQMRQASDMSENSLHNVERAIGKTRGDIALQYLQLLGGALLVDSLIIASYSEFLQWYEMLRKAQNLSHYQVSQTTQIPKTSLYNLNNAPNQRINISIILKILTAYSTNLQITWLSLPAPLLAEQPDNCVQPSEVGDMLQRARWKAGIPIQEMANKCSTKESVLMSLEAGEGRAKIDLVLKYIDYLGVKFVIQCGDQEYEIKDASEMRAWLIQFRLKRNLTVLELSNASKVNVVVIRNYEKGTTSTYFYSCVKLIHALGGKLLIRE